MLVVLSYLATLVSAFPVAKQGLVVCADQSFTVTGQAQEDRSKVALGIAPHARKLFPAGRDAVFATIGLSRIVDKGRTVFDLGREATEAIKKTGVPDSRQRFYELGQIIAADFAKSGGVGALPSNLPDGGKDLFAIEVFRFKAGRPLMWRVSFSYAAHSAVSTLVVEPELREGNGDFAGQMALPLELVGGHDARFDDVRRMYRAYAAIKDKTPAATMSFSRWLFKQASSRSQLLSSDQVGIGAIADCAFVDDHQVTWSMANSEKSHDEPAFPWSENPTHSGSGGR